AAPRIFVSPFLNLGMISSSGFSNRRTPSSSSGCGSYAARFCIGTETGGVSPAGGHHPLLPAAAHTPPVSVPIQKTFSSTGFPLHTDTGRDSFPSDDSGFPHHRAAPDQWLRYPPCGSVFFLPPSRIPSARLLPSEFLHESAPSLTIPDHPAGPAPESRSPDSFLPFAKARRKAASLSGFSPAHTAFAFPRHVSEFR